MLIIMFFIDITFYIYTHRGTVRNHLSIWECLSVVCSYPLCQGYAYLPVLHLSSGMCSSPRGCVLEECTQKRLCAGRSVLVFGCRVGRHPSLLPLTQAGEVTGITKSPVCMRQERVGSVSQVQCTFLVAGDSVGRTIRVSVRPGQLCLRPCPAPEQMLGLWETDPGVMPSM